MRLVTSQQMRDIDACAIEQHHIPSRTLMENAGKQVANLIKTKIENVNHKTVYIFCGKGNNGGDGFVAARYLSRMGARVYVFLIGKNGDVKGDARWNFELARQMRIPVLEMAEEKDLQNFHEEATQYRQNQKWTFTRPEPDILVDALLGTGAKGEPQGTLKNAIQLINALNKPVVSVDVPSGLDADTGKISGECVQATWTVTMGLPKLGFFIFPGAEKVGELVVADIGFPEALLTGSAKDPQLLTKEFIKTLLPLPRKRNTHKGDYGRVLIVAASPGMTGAACLCAESCLRSGAGLVTVAVPKSLNPILETKLTEAMTLPAAETPDGFLSHEALELLLLFSKKCDAVAIGPGISTHPETRKLVRELVENLTVPFVIDADGLNCLSDDNGLESLKIKKAPCILTPHPGELARLLNSTAKEIQENRLHFAAQAAQTTSSIVILKGSYSLIAGEAQQLFVNPTGNPGMATGGTGDVLTGMVAGFLAQKLTPLSSALLATYLHGAAGDNARGAYGELSLLASDIIHALPDAIKMLL